MEKSDTKSKSFQYYYWIDILRILSMTIVLFCHFKMAFFSDKDNYIYIKNCTIKNYFYEGNLAVCVFILISCFIFASKGYERLYSRQEIKKLIIQRFFRLWIPVVVVNVIIVILYNCNFFFSTSIVGHDYNWFELGSFVKSIISSIWADLNVCLFTNGFNPPLWCYNMIFIFPLISFLIFQLIRKEKAIIYIGSLFFLILLLNNSYLAIVPIVCMIVVCGKQRLFSIIAFIGAGGSIVIHSLQASSPDLFSQYNVAINIVLASAVFELLFYYNGKYNIIIPFSKKINRFCMGIYLLHMPLICSLGFYLYSKNIDKRAICIVILLILILLSSIFNSLVENKLTKYVIWYIDKKLK